MSVWGDTAKAGQMQWSDSMGRKMSSESAENWMNHQAGSYSRPAEGTVGEADGAVQSQTKASGSDWNNRLQDIRNELVATEMVESGLSEEEAAEYVFANAGGEFLEAGPISGGLDFSRVPNGVERLLLISDARQITGQDLRIDNVGQMYNASPTSVNTDGTSGTARSDFAKAMAATNAIEAVSRDNASYVTWENVPKGSNTIQIDFADFANTRYVGMSPRNFSVGMVMLHELQHTQSMGGLVDPPDFMLKQAQFADTKGDVVSHVNIIEGELNLLQRHQYSPTTEKSGFRYVLFGVDGKAYVP